MRFFSNQEVEMLLICLRDDIPLSLNDDQYYAVQSHIRDRLYDLTGKYHYVDKFDNNLSVHGIHNIFFVDYPESNLNVIEFIPDVVCNLYEPIIEPRSGQMVYRDNTAYAGLHDMIFEGNRISFYVDFKIESNANFKFWDMMQRLRPFIELHINGQNISDIYCQKNIKITQIR